MPRGLSRSGLSCRVPFRLRPLDPILFVPNGLRRSFEVKREEPASSTLLAQNPEDSKSSYRMPDTSPLLLIVTFFSEEISEQTPSAAGEKFIVTS